MLTLAAEVQEPATALLADEVVAELLYPALTAVTVTFKNLPMSPDAGV